MYKFILLLLTSSLALSQPYEPIILLDVTGEIDDGLGAGMLISLGDQDGDDFDDILTVTNHPGGGGVLRIYYGTNNGQERMLQFAHIDTSVYNYSWFDPEIAYRAGDLNGDGHADITLDLYHREGGDDHYRNVLFLGGPELFDTIPDWIGEETLMNFTMNVGDYDNDGRDDVTRRPMNPHYFGFYQSADPMLTEPTWTMERELGNNQYGYSHTGFGDFNGDGFSDFGITYRNSFVSYFDLFLGSPEVDSIPAYVYENNSENSVESEFRFVGDVNGDGYDDLMSDFVSWWLGTHKYLYYGGNPFDFEPDWDFYEQEPDALPWTQTGLGDINGDGYDDFALYGTPDDPYLEGFEIFLGGDPPALEPVWTLLSPFEGMNMPYRIGPAGDFNGDGIDDWMFSCYEGVEARGRIIVIAGDERFGQAVGDAPDFHPSSFLLHPCYPNPFNNETTIQLSLPPFLTDVTLRIYDITGRTVNEQTIHASSNIIRHRFNGGGLPTGVYFVQASAGNRQATTKIMILK